MWYAIGVYAVSIVGGWLIVSMILWVMSRSAGLPRPFSEWIDFWLGGTERAVATTLVIVAPKYLSSFIGAWVALKLAANWNRQPIKKNEKDSEKEQGQNAHARRVDKHDPENFARRALLALIGSVLSFSIAIGCGLLIFPDALIVWQQ